MAGTGRPAATDEVRQFLDIIKRRSGLRIERGEGQFAFTHLSFQEYFAAVYLADWVTSAEWLMGEEVPLGTAAADLQQYAADATWQETLVFLFELLAGAKPLGKKKIREAVFGPDWSAVMAAGRGRPSGTPNLLARLTSDPHVHWDADTRTAAVDRCLDVLAAYHDREDWNAFHSPIPALLNPLFSGEPVIARARLQRLADRWAFAGISRLVLSRVMVTDVSPLAQLTSLTDLWLDGTQVTDLTPPNMATTSFTLVGNEADSSILMSQQLDGAPETVWRS